MARVGRGVSSGGARPSPSAGECCHRRQLPETPDVRSALLVHALDGPLRARTVRRPPPFLDAVADIQGAPGVHQTGRPDVRRPGGSL
eukprot:365575-Chlamydomonas_euryale.AAC.4